MTQSPKIIAYIDGASRGNPGPAAYGVVMQSAGGSRLAAFSQHFGKATNNVAEYQGLLAALEHALTHSYLRIHVRTDSELLALQIDGVYKVKSPGLKPLHERAQQLIARLESFSIEHVPREQNRKADQLANQALDAAEAGKRQREVASPPLVPLPERGEEAGVENASKHLPPLRASATFHNGRLEPHGPIPLHEGEVVNLEIYRKD